MAMYIRLCTIFNHSGANRTEITEIFTEFMPEDDFAQDEQLELIDYLFKKAHD